MSPKTVFVREATGIIRQLTAFDGFALTVLLIGFPAGFVFYDYYIGIFMGTNFPLAILLAALPCIPIAIFYWLMTVAFPRTGGDYVWVSRILHPSIGFANNFLFTILVAISLAASDGYFLYETQTFLTLMSTWFNSPGLASLGTMVVQQPWYTIISIVYLFIIFALTASMKTLKAVIYLAFTLNVIAVILVFVEYLPVTPAMFVTHFNAWAAGATSYQGVIDAAAKYGFARSSDPSWLLMATMYVFGSYYSGYNWSSFYAGEIKNVMQSVPLIFLGSVAMTAFVWVASSFLLWTRIGPDFLSAASYLKYSQPNATAIQPLAGIPMPRMFYMTLFFGSDALGTVAKILVLLGASWFFYYMWMFSFMLIPSRQIFAWSFDRILPSKLADVDEVGWIRGPLKALTVTFVIGLTVTVVADVIPSILTLAAIFTFVELIVFCLPGIAGLVFPFTKKELFENAPTIVKKKIGPLPIISILGLITTLLGTFGGYEVFINPLLGGSTGWDWALEMFIGGIVIYYLSLFVRRRQGIDLKLVFKEIPPE